MISEIQVRFFEDGSYGFFSGGTPLNCVKKAELILDSGEPEPYADVWLTEVDPVGRFRVVGPIRTKVKVLPPPRPPLPPLLKRLFSR